MDEVAKDGDVLVRVGSEDEDTIFCVDSGIVVPALGYFRTALRCPTQESHTRIFHWPGDGVAEVQLLFEIIHFYEVDHAAISASTLLRLAFLCDRLCGYPVSLVRGVVNLWAEPLLEHLREQLESKAYYSNEEYRYIWHFRSGIYDTVEISQLLEIAIAFDLRRLCSLLSQAFVLETHSHTEPSNIMRLPSHAAGVYSKCYEPIIPLTPLLTPSSATRIVQTAIENWTSRKPSS
jgi:hypothetical protein